MAAETDSTSEALAWLAKAQATTDVPITGEDVAWAQRAFLSIVLVSAKFGRHAGEMQLAKLAAERRARHEEPTCAACASILVYTTGPAFRDPEAQRFGGIENGNAYIRVGRCKACHAIRVVATV